MVIVITWILLEPYVNALALIKSMNLFCVLLDTSQNRISSFALLISQRKVYTIWPPLRFMGEDISSHWETRETLTCFLHGKIDPSGRSRTVQRPTPARRYPVIPRQQGTPAISFSTVGIISWVRSRRWSSAPLIQASAFLKAGGLFRKPCRGSCPDH